VTRAEKAILVGCVLVGMMLGAAIGRRLGAGWLARDLLSLLGVPVGYLAGLCLVKYLHR
jgi:hypothetical protein